MLEVFLHPSAKKELGRLPTKDHNRVLAQLSILATLDHPLEHRRVIKLSGRKTDDYRLRVGNWRIKFTLKDKSVFVTEIEHRQVGY